MDFYKQAKTDTLFRVPPLPVAIDILEKYKEHPAIINSNKVLPVAIRNTTSSQHDD
jgi:hypothetical protein